MVARLKLKGIDGGSHKRWSMWLNSRLREEPYPRLDMLGCTLPETGGDRYPIRSLAQVLHGCRQVLMAFMPRAAHVLQCGVQREASPRGGANPKKRRPVQIAGCNSPA